MDKKKEYATFKGDAFLDQACFENSLETIAKQEFFVSNNSVPLQDEYTWNGTTLVTASSEPGDLSVGEWIRHSMSEFYFEVTDIDGTNITVSNPDLLTIPNTLLSAKPAYKSTSPLFSKYFGSNVLSQNNKENCYQAEEYLLNEDSSFSLFSRV